jgi:hypothetical protein
MHRQDIIEIDGCLSYRQLQQIRWQGDYTNEFVVNSDAIRGKRQGNRGTDGVGDMMSMSKRDPRLVMMRIVAPCVLVL